MESSTPALLKGEINTTQEQEHDLAKWKLIATGVLGAAAFGLSGEQHVPNYWLLFFVPFVCAYVDLYDYQYRLRVLVIGKFLRDQESDPELQSYEKRCEALRQQRSRDFDLGKWAGIGSSIGASLFGPLFYFFRRPQEKVPDTLLVSPSVALTMWGAGILLVFLLYLDFLRKERKIAGRPAAPAKSTWNELPS